VTRPRHLGAALLVVAFGQGCSDQGPDELLFAQLDAARDVWTRSRPLRYAYTLEQVCDCPPDEAGPVRIEVDGGSVLSRTYGSGAEVPGGLAGLFPTVDQLFALIDDAIAASAWDVRASYDPGTGVPLSVRIDYEPLEFGEEIAYRTVSLPSALPATLGSAPGI
jgi:hypothetical protein